MTLSDMSQFEEVTLTTLLNHRFGDGLIYVQGREDRALLKQAIRLGLVDPNGYVTTLGEQFLMERCLPAVS